MPRLPLVVLTLALAACNGDSAAPQAGPAAGNERGGAALPAPAGAPGTGVTGMPDEPGPNESGPPEVASADPALGADGLPLPVEGAPPSAPIDPATGAPLPLPPPQPMDPGAPPPPPAPPAPEPPVTVDALAAEEAIAVVREYHSAINAGALGRAYGLWADGGRASGQTPQEFADGFAAVESLAVDIAPPTRADTALARVPVTLTLRRRDGSERRLAGHYTLRRDPVDPSAGWRIAGTRLRESAP
ncbi:hypothetical protein [Cognatilysobacter bugurensis]|nr:hypothetical protein [Lysobacter bugurensis]